MSEFDYIAVIQDAEAEHGGFACDCGDRAAMIRHGINAAFNFIELEARRRASQTANTDAGRGRFTAMQEMAIFCFRVPR